MLKFRRTCRLLLNGLKFKRFLYYSLLFYYVLIWLRDKLKGIVGNVRQLLGCQSYPVVSVLASWPHIDKVRARRGSIPVSKDPGTKGNQRRKKATTWDEQHATWLIRFSPRPTATKLKKTAASIQANSLVDKAAWDRGGVTVTFPEVCRTREHPGEELRR